MHGLHEPGSKRCPPSWPPARSGPVCSPAPRPVAPASSSLQKWTNPQRPPRLRWFGEASRRTLPGSAVPIQIQIRPPSSTGAGCRRQNHLQQARRNRHVITRSRDLEPLQIAKIVPLLATRFGHLRMAWAACPVCQRMSGSLGQ